MNTRPILTAEKICKSYHINEKNVDVLSGASMSINRGETVAVIGASGAGKSTLLHILGGLDEPDAGQVFYEGEAVYGMKTASRADLRARHIGFIFQSYNLFHEMTVFENVMLPAMATPETQGASKLEEKVSELLALVGMWQRALHRPMELSGGEQQRVPLHGHS